MALEFPNIDPVALALGPLEIRWYALAYLAGFLIGWRLCRRIVAGMPGGRITPEDIDDMLPWLILGVILGGRIGYVLFYQPALYLSDPLAIIKVWQGGMAFHGGLLGVIVAMVAYARVKKLSLLSVADAVACVVPIGLFFGRIANFINGELYGRVTDVSWAVVFPGGGDLPRHPSQIYQALGEGILLFVLMMILLKLKVHHRYPGAAAGMFLTGYGCARYFIEYTRQPDRQIGFIFDMFTMGQVLCVPMVLVGAGLIVFARQRAAA